MVKTGKVLTRMSEYANGLATRNSKYIKILSFASRILTRKDHKKHFSTIRLNLYLQITFLKIKTLRLLKTLLDLLYMKNL